MRTPQQGVCIILDIVTEVDLIHSGCVTASSNSCTLSLSHWVTMPSISMIVMPATIKEVTTTTARSNFRCLFRSMSSRGRWFSRRWKIPPVARISDLL